MSYLLHLTIIRPEVVMCLLHIGIQESIESYYKGGIATIALWDKVRYVVGQDPPIELVSGKLAGLLYMGSALPEWSLVKISAYVRTINHRYFSF